jgi:mono/diheme cytochrome c family protein
LQLKNSAGDRDALSSSLPAQALCGVEMRLLTLIGVVAADMRPTAIGKTVRRVSRTLLWKPWVMIGRPTAIVMLRLVAVALFLAAGLRPLEAADEASIKRGEGVFNAADCTACHTDVKGGAQPLAGGRPLDTPFGRFYAPNISSDKQYGIGAWSEAEFHRALREGLGRKGGYLFPVFPYPAFTKMSDQDIADLYAYLQSRPAAAQPNKTHEVGFPFNWRFLQIFWRSLFFTEGPLEPTAGQSAEWNRGRYLVEAVVHCGECHTPRNFLGGLEQAQAFAGNPDGPDGQKAPNISSDTERGIGQWSIDDIAKLLKTGQTPSFDFVGSGMGEVIKGTGAMSDSDRRAIAVYIKSVPPVRRAVGWRGLLLAFGSTAIAACLVLLAVVLALILALVRVFHRRQLRRA